jgi:photosystem II stability/assembly factor-like uncharacterized protein
MGKLLVIILIALLQLSAGSCSREVRWENVPQIKSIAFKAPDHAWLVTTKRDLLLTQNGGKEWKTISASVVGGFQAITMLDNRRGLAVSSRGQVWRTEDGGQTWAAKAMLKADDWHYNESNQIEFVDDLHGWIIETLTIWRTEDGGATWQKAFAPFDQRAAGQPVRAFFGDAQHVWVCGTYGELYRTADGGKTWVTETIAGKESAFRDIFFISQKTGWLIGYMSGEFNNLFYRTDDGGKTWNPIQTNIHRTYLTSLYFLDEKEGWACGEAWPNGGNGDSGRGVLMHTTDGGQTWQSTFTTDDPFFDRIRFLNEREGWLFARDRVYRTDDSGKDWRSVLKLPPTKTG